MKPTETPSKPQPKRQPWAIVLAAGEGSRLAGLTAQLYGEALPKQFAVLQGTRSLLQATMDRIAPLVPPERTVVVTSRGHAALTKRQLAGFPGVDVIVQPSNVGTGPGIMLPLARVLARDPDADVLIFPSDHHFKSPLTFLGGVQSALDAAMCARSGLCLLAVPSERAATDLGWIVPGRRIPRSTAYTIEKFVEKPSDAIARTLHATGAIWNTLVTAARGPALWRLAARHLPTQAALFTRYLTAVDTAADTATLDLIYRYMPTADFSRQVLTPARGLGVVGVEGCGWSDWGTPDRLFESLSESGDLAALKARLRVGPVGAHPRAGAMPEWRAAAG